MPRHPFYNTRTWKYLRKVKLVTDPLCEDCKVKLATDVHHVKAINAGGSKTDLSNMAALCHQCHSKRTLYERFRIDRIPVKGCRADGTPLDPEHPWNRDTSVQGGRKIVAPGPFKRQSEDDSEEKTCCI